MRHALRYGLAVGILIAAAASGQAADLHPAPPMYKAPPAPIFSWTGCYIGGNVGGNWGRASDGWVANPVGFGDPAFITANGSNTMDGSGGIGGGQLGCNYQTGVFVLGLEGDLDWSGLKGSRDLTTANLGAVQIYHSDFSQRWLSTVRGRAGVTFDRWLLYVTGGVAIANINYTDAVFFAASGTTTAGTASATRTGYAIGGGVETAIWRNWSVKAEYLFADIKGPDFVAVNPVFPAATVATSHELKEHVFRVGLNFKFF